MVFNRFRKFAFAALLVLLVLLCVALPAFAFPIPNCGAYVSKGVFPNDEYLFTVPYDVTDYSFVVDTSVTTNIVIPIIPNLRSGVVKIYSPDAYFDLDVRYSKNKVSQFTPINEIKQDIYEYTLRPELETIYTNVVLSLKNFVPRAGVYGRWEYEAPPSRVDMFPLNTSVNIPLVGYVQGDMEDGACNQLRFYRNSSGLYVVADLEGGGSIDLMSASQWLAPYGYIAIDEVEPDHTYYNAFLQFLQTNLIRSVSSEIQVTISLPYSQYPANSLFNGYNNRISDLINQLEYTNPEGSPDILQWLKKGVDGFMGVKVFGVGEKAVTIGALFTLAVAVPMLFLFLKVFLGG